MCQIFQKTKTHHGTHSKSTVFANCQESRRIQDSFSGQHYLYQSTHFCILDHVLKRVVVTFERQTKAEIPLLAFIPHMLSILYPLHCIQASYLQISPQKVIIKTLLSARIIFELLKYVSELRGRTSTELNCRKLSTFGEFPELLKLLWNLVDNSFCKCGSCLRTLTLYEMTRSWN